MKQTKSPVTFGIIFLLFSPAGHAQIAQRNNAVSLEFNYLFSRSGYNSIFPQIKYIGRLNPSLSLTGGIGFSFSDNQIGTDTHGKLYMIPISFGIEYEAKTTGTQSMILMGSAMFSVTSQSVKGIQYSQIVPGIEFGFANRFYSKNKISIDLQMKGLFHTTRLWGTTYYEDRGYYAQGQPRSEGYISINGIKFGIVINIHT